MHTWLRCALERRGPGRYPCATKHGIVFSQDAAPGDMLGILRPMEVISRCGIALEGSKGEKPILERNLRVDKTFFVDAPVVKSWLEYVVVANPAMHKFRDMLDPVEVDQVQGVRQT